MPEKTIGSAFLNPGSGASAGVRADVTVSPTSVSAMDLMLAVKYPTSPAVSASRRSSERGDIVPVSTTSNSAPVCIIRTRSPGASLPSYSRTYTITPL